MSKIDWPALKSAGYRIDKSSMWARRGIEWGCWLSNGSWSGRRFKTKGEAMRECRDHYDRKMGHAE